MDLKPTFSVVYKEVNDSKILTDVFIPSFKAYERTAQESPLIPTEVPVIYVVHGGGWLMGHPIMNPKAQVEDSLERGWIVLAPDHRLCPQVDILEGPMGDIRSFHSWVHAGHLDAVLKERGIPLAVDKRKIIATGSASGGHACLGLAFSDDKTTPRPAAFMEFYAPKNFAHPWWTGPRDKLNVNAPTLTPEMERLVFSEHPVPSRVDLPAKPDSAGKITLPESDSTHPTFVSARVAYATDVILNHKLLDICYPYPSDQTVSATEHYRPIDPVLNVHPLWPPTCFVHGIDDNLLPHEVTTKPLIEALQRQGVKCKFVGIKGGKHMFVMTMTRQSAEWAVVKEAMDWLEDTINEVK
ncbi:hypothetical protein ABHI18_011872 [Aspergillus niger]